MIREIGTTTDVHRCDQCGNPMSIAMTSGGQEILKCPTCGYTLIVKLQSSCTRT